MPKQFKATIEEHKCNQPNCLKISLEDGCTVYISTIENIATLAKYIKSLSEGFIEANKTKHVVQIGEYSGYVFLKNSSVFIEVPFGPFGLTDDSKYLEEKARKIYQKLLPRN